jgi:nicotinate-nucleotide adenylyltransferase
MAENSAGRIGIFGGSFDPVHLGHLLIAERAYEQFELTQVRWIPAAFAPHPQLKETATAAHRLAMVQLAISGNPHFVCDDRELRRGGVSYTVDTLLEIRRELPQAELCLVIGADSLREFSKWRQPEMICQLAHVVVVARGGQPRLELNELAKYLSPAKSPEQLEIEHQLRMPQLEISSSEIRQRVQRQRSIRYMVPAAVEAYILEHNLYRATS